MAEYNIIKLTELSPLHIGTGKENYDFSATELQSDTLIAALAAMRVMCGKGAGLESFLHSFTLSSAFPFKKRRLFFPKTQSKMAVSVKDMQDFQYRKRLKGIKYIELPLWQKMINGEHLEVEEKQLQKKFLLANSLDFSPISESQVNQRVTVPREEGQDAQPFFFDWVYFNKDSGLFCLTDAKDEILEELKTLFELLGENGLGTDKNMGGGKFKVEIDKVTIIHPQNANATMLLSLYLPTEEELPDLRLEEAAYELLLRGGYLAGSCEDSLKHLRKRSIYMFGVGSVFPSDRKRKGKIVDLKPDWNDSIMHAVWRSGIAFCLPIKSV